MIQVCTSVFYLKKMNKWKIKGDGERNCNHGFYKGNKCTVREVCEAGAGYEDSKIVVSCAVGLTEEFKEEVGSSEISSCLEVDR